MISCGRYDKDSWSAIFAIIGIVVLIPGIIGPFIGKTVLVGAKVIVGGDGTESFIPNENIFMAALLVIVLLAVLMLVCAKQIKKAMDKAC